MGMILILIGVGHILFPSGTLKFVKQANINNPFIKKENFDKVRTQFVIIFGIVWIAAAMLILFFG
jgi:hypothetical protein